MIEADRNLYRLGNNLLAYFDDYNNMKKLKPRTYVYTVVRLAPKGSGIEPHVKDSFSTLERAEEMCEVYQQELHEKEVYGFEFKIFLNCFYD